MVYKLIFCMCLTDALLGSFYLGLATAWLLGFGHISPSVKFHLKLSFSCKLLSSHSSAPRTFLLFGLVIRGLPMTHPPSSINSTPVV